MAEGLRPTPRTEARPHKARRLLPKISAVIGVAAILAGVSPVLVAEASNPSSHDQTATHKKSRPKTKETPLERATKKILIHLATQIITDYNQAKGGQIEQGVAYDDHSAPAEPGREVFYVVYPLGPNQTITDPGTGIPRVVSLGGTDRVDTVISYPRADKHPPSKINLNNLVGVNIAESIENNTGVGPRYPPGPQYSFGAEGDGKGHWYVYELLASPLQEGGIATLNQWAYVVGRYPSSPHTAPLTTHVLTVEGSEAQTVLNNAKQYVTTPFTTALEAPLPIPTAKQCENGFGVTQC